MFAARDVSKSTSTDERVSKKKVVAISRPKNMFIEVASTWRQCYPPTHKYASHSLGITVAKAKGGPDAGRH